MVGVFFYLFDNAVLDMNNFVGLVGYTTFVGNNYNGKFFFFVKFIINLQKIIKFNFKWGKC